MWMMRISLYINIQTCVYVCLWRSERERETWLWLYWLKKKLLNHFRLLTQLNLSGASLSNIIVLHIRRPRRLKNSFEICWISYIPTTVYFVYVHAYAYIKTLHTHHTHIYKTLDMFNVVLLKFSLIKFYKWNLNWDFVNRPRAHTLAIIGKENVV